MLVHTDERPFSCKLCDKRYVSRYGLKIHLHVHTKEKPFKCELCSKDFVERGSLNRHYLVHSKEKPFNFSAGKVSLRWAT